MIMSAAQRYEAIVAANQGKRVSFRMRNETEARELKIVRLDTDKKGAMRDHSQASYMVLADDENKYVVPIHPNPASLLFDTLKTPTMEMLDTLTMPAEVELSDAEAAAARQAKIDQRKAETAEKAEQRANASAAAKAERAASKPPTKMSQAQSIYKSMMVGDEHPKRADVIKRFIAELNMSSAGAATYQNTCKQHFTK